MSETKIPSDRPDRRIVAAVLAAIAITVVVVAVIAGVGSGSPAPSASSAATQPPVAIADQVVADGRAVPTKTAELAADVPGTVETVPIELGQQVTAGTTLVTLETDAIDLELAGATAAAEAATARSEQAAASVKQAAEQVAVAEATLDQAQAALATARDRNVGEDEAAAARNAARAQVRSAKAGLAVAQAGGRAAAADARRAATAVSSLEETKAGYTLVAPIAGTVASLGASVGQQVTPAQVLVRIADTTDWTFETTDLDESGIARIAVGDPATVTLDGVPGVEIPGTVTRIGTFGESRQGGIVYRVVVTPTGDVPDGIRWNMTATIAIKGGQ